MAEPFMFLGARPVVALHGALGVLLLCAGFGTYSLARRHVPPLAAALAATCYLTANYVVANLYLRGAYYEVAGLAALP